MCVGRMVCVAGWFLCWLCRSWAAAAPAVVAADAASLSVANESPSSLVPVNSQWNSCLGTAYRNSCFKTAFEGVPQIKR